jgi:hypothetical protein
MRAMQDSGGETRKPTKRLNLWIDYGIVLFVLSLAATAFLMFRHH